MPGANEPEPETPLISRTSLEEADGVRTLTAELTGDLTVVNAPELLTALRRLIDRRDAGRVVLCFDDVGYVDSGASGR